jgi:hypothetical protein
MLCVLVMLAMRVTKVTTPRLSKAAGNTGMDHRYYNTSIDPWCTKHNQGCITTSSYTSNSTVANLISGSSNHTLSLELDLQEIHHWNPNMLFLKWLLLHSLLVWLPSSCDFFIIVLTILGTRLSLTRIPQPSRSIPWSKNLIVQHAFAYQS